MSTSELTQIRHEISQFGLEFLAKPFNSMGCVIFDLDILIVMARNDPRSFTQTQIAFHPYVAQYK
jgi:hypothetical protein